MKPKERISVTLHEDLRRWIKEKSDATGVSVSGLIGMYLCEKREAERRKR